MKQPFIRRPQNAHGFAARLLKKRLVCCTLLLGMPACFAGEYNITKKATWGTTDVAQPFEGKFLEFLTHTFADEKGAAAQHHDGPHNGFTSTPDLTKSLAKGGDVYADTPVTGTEQWTKIQDFKIPPAPPFDLMGDHEGEPPPPPTPILADKMPDDRKANDADHTHQSADTGHAKADAGVGAEARSNQGATGQETTITLNFNGSASTKPQQLVDDKVGATQYAEAASGGKVKINKRLLKASVLDGKTESDLTIDGGGYLFGVGTGFVSSAQPGSKTPPPPPGAPPVPPRKGGTSYHDPFALSFYDSLDGHLIAEELLFSSLEEALGNAEFEIDPDLGVTLKADSDSEALMSYDTLSSWILNPFHGSAGIKDGQFYSTGDFAALPWQITTSAFGDITAFLPSSAFDGGFDFQIKPTGLGTPENDLIAELSFDSAAETFAYSTQVPETGNSLILLGASTAFLIGFSKKMRVRPVAK